MYNLETSQADRVSFDNMIAQYAEDMLDTLAINEALALDPQEYAGMVWPTFEAEMSVDDPEEAKARFFAEFPSSIKTWQEDNKEI